MATKSVAYVVKMFPRLSETFIINEILALEEKGLKIQIISLFTTDSKVMHEATKSIKADVHYLPASFWREILHMLKSQVHFLTRYPSRWAHAFAVMFFRHSFKAVKLWLQAGSVAEFLENTELVHIHAHFSTAPTTIAMIVGIYLDIHYSLTCHAKDVYAAGRLRSPGFFRNLNRAEFVVCVSEQTKKDILAVWPQLPSEKIHVVYNGLDLQRFRQRSSEPSEGLILAVGRLVEKKGFSYLIRACQLLKTRSIPFECEIIGDGELGKDLKGLVSSLSLDNEVKLVGALPQQELISHYEKASIFCLPAIVADNQDRDILPNVVKEAMAAGVPVVTTSIPAMNELVEHGRTGVLVPPRDVESLAAELEELLHDRILGRRLAEAARGMIDQKFDRTKNVYYLLQLFEKYLSTPSMMPKL